MSSLFLLQIMALKSAAVFDKMGQVLSGAGAAGVIAKVKSVYHFTITADGSTTILKVIYT